MRTFIFSLLLIAVLFSCGQKNTPVNSLEMAEKHRPVFHFTPDSMWMNDPNGMVFYKDTYHLFYQYYPDSTIWGPMHWGHAVSRDMINWEHKPIALYPDEYGYIFSGSAVVDINNTSGLGSLENPPLVAIYTYHNPKAESPAEVQSQGIACSLDNGETWQKYEDNPVLKSPGIKDFRDPKVRWHETSERWIMTLAVQDHIRFYSSPNLLDWQFESEFGKEIGAHGGVWECPDLFPMKEEKSGETSWILIVNLNPGAPNGGSGTQYFIGNFDGHRFLPIDEKTRWLDYGPDNYAGITWSNTGDRTLFIGWMSNWKYANIVPTERWRSAATIARELTLKKSGDNLLVLSMPVKEFDEITFPVIQKEGFEISSGYLINEKSKSKLSTFVFDLEIIEPDGFNIVLSNNYSSELVIRYNKANNRFVIDRGISGDVSFHEEFKNIISADRFSTDSLMNLKLVVDVASLELFADDGSTVLTTIFFPEQVLDKIELIPDSKLSISKLSLMKVK